MGGTRPPPEARVGSAHKMVQSGVIWRMMAANEEAETKLAVLRLLVVTCATTQLDDGGKTVVENPRGVSTKGGHELPPPLQMDSRGSQA